MKDKSFINSYGLFSTIIVTVVGVGVFAFPSRLASEVGTDGWLITLASGAITYFLLYLIYKIEKINDYNNFYSILNNNFGDIMSKIFSIFFATYTIYSVAIGMRIFSEVIKMYLLNNTPTEFILIVMILTGVYLVRGDLKALIKFNEVCFWVMFIPVIFVLFFATRGGDFTNILPLMTHKPMNYIVALTNSTYSFAGFEMAYLIFPFASNKEKIPKVMKWSMIFITLFYTIVMILCLAFFTEKHLRTLLWPTITLIRAIVIPGAFIERWEGIIMAIWVIFYFTTFVNFYYFAADTLKHAFNLGDVKVSSLLAVPFIYLIALYPDNIVELYTFESKVTPIFSLIIFIVLPLMLLMLGRSRRRRRVQDEV